MKRKGKRGGIKTLIRQKKEGGRREEKLELRYEGVEERR